MRIILLEDRNLKYNSTIDMTVLNLIDDLDIGHKLIKFNDKNDLMGSPHYKEEGEYEYHHFSFHRYGPYNYSLKFEVPDFEYKEY